MMMRGKQGKGLGLLPVKSCPLLTTAVAVYSLWSQIRVFSRTQMLFIRSSRKRENFTRFIRDTNEKLPDLFVTKIKNCQICSRQKSKGG